MSKYQFDTNKLFNSLNEGAYVPGAEGRHVPSAEGRHVPSAEGRHVHGAEGAHVHGAEGRHLSGAENGPAKDEEDVNAPVWRWEDLTLKQQHVLEWLARRLNGEEKKAIPCLYKRISIDLGMSPRAVRVHCDALKKKGIIASEIIYRENYCQRIGLCVKMSINAPITHLPIRRRVTKAEMEAMEEWDRIGEQRRMLMMQGYILVPEIRSWVLEPAKYRR